MAMLLATGTTTLSIGRRRVNDPRLYEISVESIEYAYIASAINIALAMLETPQSKAQLVYMAELFDDRRHGNALFNGDNAQISQWVGWFISQLRTRFGPVIIDDNITTLDVLGYHQRLPWDFRGNNLIEFPFRTQGVHLNSSRVGDMVTAGQDMSSQGQRRFREFQFAFAATFVHEVGAHLLLTWIGGGVPDTPDTMMVDGYQTRPDVGESGRFFEMSVFGGTMEYYRDTRQDDRQLGVPYLLDNAGRAWKVDPSFIDAVCNYQISFPFRRTGNAVNRLTMRSMGYGTHNPFAEGSQRTLMARQVLTPQLRGLRAYRVRLSDVRLVATNPRKRLAAVA